MSQSQLPPAGWYPDPGGSGGERYWDGGSWSRVTRPSPEPPATPSAGRYGPQPLGTQPHGYQPQAPYGPYVQVRQARLAGWWWRVLAYVIDWLILLVPVAFFQDLFMGDDVTGVQAWVDDVFRALQQGATVLPDIPPDVWSTVFWNAVISLLVYAVYGTVLVTRLGGTLGQVALGMRVIADGDQGLSRIGWGRSAVRAVAANVLINIPLLGLLNFLMPLFTRKKQTIHDMIAQTVMVKK